MYAFIAAAVLPALLSVTQAALSDCYIEPYAAALNTTTCGPLDGDCVCQSSTYLNALQEDIPKACDTTDQDPIFSYIMAACSEFGYGLSLTTTSVSLTTSVVPTTTVTTTLRVTQSAKATGAALAVVSDCATPGVSSSATAGIAIAAFVVGGLLFAAGAVLLMRKRRARASPEKVPFTPYTEYTAGSPPPSSYFNKPLPMVEAETKSPRVELMPREGRGSDGRPAELS